MKVYFCFLGIFVFGLLTSQNTEFKEHISNFNMISFTYKQNNKWSAYFELQSRSIEDYMLPDYYEIKGGPAYNFNKNNQILVGFGRYGTYRNSTFSIREYRLWLQYVLSHQLGRVKFDHRFRAEKRFFYAPQTEISTNDERYRYRLSLTVPINNSKMESKTFFLNTFDELFFGPKNPDFFKRNRFFGGFGYKFNDYVNSNFGYMYQKELSSLRGNRDYHFLYFGLNFTFDRLKHYESQEIPVAD